MLSQKSLCQGIYIGQVKCCIGSVANIVAKPWNWATFDPGAAGKKWVPQFADPITVYVISMGYFETLAPRFRRCLRCGLANFNWQHCALVSLYLQLTLVKSTGCVIQHAIADAMPPWYHLAISFVLGSCVCWVAMMLCRVYVKIVNIYSYYY